MFEYTASIRKNNRQAGPDAPKAVEVLDMRDQTAVAKVTAFWGTDYLLLAKYEGNWKIRHVIWQTDPPKLAEQ